MKFFRHSRNKEPKDEEVKKKSKCGEEIEKLKDDLKKYDFSDILTEGSQDLQEFATQNIAPLVNKRLSLDPQSKFDPKAFEIYEVLSKKSEESITKELIIPEYSITCEEDGGPIHLEFSGDFSYKTVSTVDDGDNLDLEYVSQSDDEVFTASSCLCINLCADPYRENDDDSEGSTTDGEAPNELLGSTSFSFDEDLILSRCASSELTEDENEHERYAKRYNSSLSTNSSQSSSDILIRVKPDSIENDTEHNINILRKKKKNLQGSKLSKIDESSVDSMILTNDKYFNTFQKKQNRKTKWNVTMPIILDERVEMKMLSFEDSIASRQPPGHESLSSTTPADRDEQNMSSRIESHEGREGEMTNQENPKVEFNEDCRNISSKANLCITSSSRGNRQRYDSVFADLEMLREKDTILSSSGSCGSPKVSNHNSDQIEMISNSQSLPKEKQNNPQARQPPRSVLKNVRYVLKSMHPINELMDDYLMDIPKTGTNGSSAALGSILTESTQNALQWQQERDDAMLTLASSFQEPTGDDPFHAEQNGSEWNFDINYEHSNGENVCSLMDSVEINVIAYPASVQSSSCGSTPEDLEQNGTENREVEKIHAKDKKPFVRTPVSPTIRMPKISRRIKTTDTLSSVQSTRSWVKDSGSIASKSRLSVGSPGSRRVIYSPSHTMSMITESRKVVSSAEVKRANAAALRKKFEFPDVVVKQTRGLGRVTPGSVASSSKYATSKKSSKKNRKKISIVRKTVKEEKILRNSTESMDLSENESAKLRRLGIKGLARTNIFEVKKSMLLKRLGHSKT